MGRRQMAPGGSRSLPPQAAISTVPAANLTGVALPSETRSRHVTVHVHHDHDSDRPAGGRGRGVMVATATFSGAALPCS